LTPSVKIFPINQTMTTPVSQTASASNTKNTKDNRKIVVAKYHDEAVYKLPNNLDLEDKSVVDSYWIKWGVLNICYSSKENLERFTNQPEDKDDCIQKTPKGFEANVWVQEIQPHYDCDDQHKFPQLTEIDDADEYGVDYEQDDEDYDEEEEKVEDKEVQKEKKEEEEEKKEEKKEEKEDDDEDNGLLVYKVLDIKFPADNDYEVPDPTMPELVKSRLWEARDEEHLCDVISDETGWLCEGVVCERVI